LLLELRPGFTLLDEAEGMIFMTDESYSGSVQENTGAEAAYGLNADPEVQAVQQLSLDEQQTQFASRVVWCMPKIAKMRRATSFSMGATLLVTFR
jgi:hypothetical protein